MEVEEKIVFYLSKIAIANISNLGVAVVSKFIVFSKILESEIFSHPLHMPHEIKNLLFRVSY